MSKCLHMTHDSVHLNTVAASRSWELYIVESTNYVNNKNIAIAKEAKKTVK